MRGALMTATLALGLGLAGTAVAADNGMGGVSEWPLGLRAGLTSDPDQVHAGVHLDAGRFHPRVVFRPGFELGLGDDQVVAAINLDALYYVPRGSGDVQAYVGGGPGVAWFDRDEDFPGRAAGDSDVEAGLNVVGGLEFGPRERYLVELRGGLGDLPELKLTAGIRF